MSSKVDLEHRRDQLVEDIRWEQWRQDNKLANPIRIAESKRYIKNMRRELEEVKKQLLPTPDEHP